MIPGWGRFPREGNGNPFQYFCLENPIKRGAWQATVHMVAKSLTQLKRLSTHACTGSFMPSNTTHHHFWWFQEQQCPGFWFSTTSSSMITASASPQSFPGSLFVTLSLPTTTNAAINFSCKLPTFHHCLYLSCSSRLIPNFNSSTSPRHTIQSLPPILPHPTRDLTSLRNQVRIQIITTITSLVPNFDCLASPAFCHPLSQQLWLNPTTPAPTQLNRRDTQPCSLVSLQNHEPHVPSKTEEQSY